MTMIPVNTPPNWRVYQYSALEWAVRHIKNGEPDRALTCIRQAMEAAEALVLDPQLEYLDSYVGPV